MSLSDEIRKSIAAAQAASKATADNPYKRVLEEVAKGLSGPAAEARLKEKPAGRWTLVLAPAHRPGRGVSMLDVRIGPTDATVFLDPPEVAHSAEELADILKRFVTTPAFLESLDEIARLSEQPIEGFLRVRAKTVSREDVMLEILPETQKTIATNVGVEITIHACVFPFRGAGAFQSDVTYTVLESGGFSVLLSSVYEQENRSLVLKGRVEPPQL